MARYAAGDAGAFGELFARYEPRAYAYFLRRTRSRERAQDLYQELFLRVHRARDAYEPARAFAPWFFQIARRLWIDDQRRAYRTHEVSIGEQEPSAAAPGPGERAADREELARVLGALSADEASVLVAAKGEGIGYAQLAAELGRSVDSVKQLASRALRRVRAIPVAVELGAVPRAR